MMNDFPDGYTYDKNETCASPVIVSNTLVDYANMIAREGGKTNIMNVLVIDMDAVKNSLKISPPPKSMDVTFIVSKDTGDGNAAKKSGKKHKQYILADFKFNVTSPDKVDKNISNEDIKGKFQFSINHIRSKDFQIPCRPTAYFVFGNTNFEQIKNRWLRRNLNSPANMAMRLVDFEKVF